MDRVLHFVLALAVVAVLALLVSSDRKKIRIRYVIQLLVIEVLLAWFFLNSDVGLGFVKGFSEMFEKLLGFANEGTNFVFGNMNDQGLAFFFLKVLCPIVFISALIGILQHIRVLPVVIRAIGFLLSKVNGMGKLESFNAVSSLILGQSENFIAYKDILGKMSRNRMYTMAATAIRFHRADRGAERAVRNCYRLVRLQHLLPGHSGLHLLPGRMGNGRTVQ